MSNDGCKNHLVIGDKTFSNRLFLGSGKFPNLETMQKTLNESKCEMVTIALHRADINNPESNKNNILNFIDKNIFILPNTAGANTSDEAIRLAKLAYAAGLPKWIKLEVHPDKKYLLPDPIGTLKAAEVLVKEGWTVLPYINADPALARHLEDVGVSAIMPLGSPIGSEQGIKTKDFIKIIIEQSKIPVIVDAGLGMPSHACEAMEMGADAVLVNTAISIAKDPVNFAIAFKNATSAGHLAYLSNSKVDKSSQAIATSPQSILS